MQFMVGKQIGVAPMEGDLCLPAMLGVEGGGADAAGDLSAKSSSPPQACAACKHQRKRCGASCLLAPFFPPEKAREFQWVHQVFGVSNVTKRLRQLADRGDRARAAEAMVWEARCWIEEDPVEGARGRWAQAQREAIGLRLQAQQCMLCSGRTMTVASNAGMIVANHVAPPSYNHQLVPMDDLRSYRQYAQVQGGHTIGVGMFSLPPPGAVPPPDHHPAFDDFGNQPQYDPFYDQFQRR